MNAVFVNIVISPEEYQRWYQGTARDVLAKTVDGRSVRFPAPILRRFVTREGIRGRFKITFDAQNRFQDIEKID
ncbi:DUF2835 domain-containing protein [Marinimicrobium sp. ABcell2]|uniref:DUF2835 domain-containing protein n=1 Tax=Marinimicrobium sp. ABcell2 TaxID=3069751 RepID=UPI0027B33B32|nr:DUF2835 domain-containing protein [Marinimicrobium sp. ABcell2]MDQ2075630.1 DUF2835 domain-containing protein [Marinimicrobium sp. ABcell2]